MLMTANVLTLLGALVTGYGVIRILLRTAAPKPGPTQHIFPVGIPSGEAFGTPTVTQHDPPSRVEKLAGKARSWVRPGDLFTTPPTPASA
jgi:hypothetical protein